jgi:hypothetical protein
MARTSIRSRTSASPRPRLTAVEATSPLKGASASPGSKALAFVAPWPQKPLIVDMTTIALSIPGHRYVPGRGLNAWAFRYPNTLRRRAGCAKSRHPTAAWRRGKVDPMLSFPISPGYGRRTPESGPRRSGRMLLHPALGLRLRLANKAMRAQQIRMIIEAQACGSAVLSKEPV